MIAPRPRGRAGAGALFALAIIALAQPLAPGTQVKSAHAQPNTVVVVSTVKTLERPQATFPIAPLQISAARLQDVQVPVGRPVVQVPILMYHYIRVNPNPGDKMGYDLSVTPDDFRAQMDWLSANDWHPITLTTLRSYWDGQPLPSKPIVLTFDDGYLDFYTSAFPILHEHHFPAVSYIVAGFIGMPGRYMTATQIQEMDKAGIEIGAHTVSHPNLAKLAPAQMHREVMDSKVALEQLVGHQVLDFSYPFGNFDALVVQMVAEQGYQSATTTMEGVGHASGDRFTWARTRVHGGESLDDFVRRLARHEDGVGSPGPVITLPRVYPFVYLRLGDQ